MIVPDDAVKYILFQRTGYLRSPITMLYRYVLRHLPFHLPAYNFVVAIESRIGKSRVKRLYRDDMRNEFESIREFLPESCSVVLDIGCGVAGIDVFINRHYTSQSPDFYLLDKSGINKSVFYMFHEEASFYNSLDVARALLVVNGVSPDRVHLREANSRNEIAVPPGIDVVLSLLSWGFHYPVTTYAEQVHEYLNEYGVVILDVRKGTDGIDTLKRMFTQVSVIQENAKEYRVAARK